MSYGMGSYRGIQVHRFDLRSFSSDELRAERERMISSDIPRDQWRLYFNWPIAWIDDELRERAAYAATEAVTRGRKP